MLPPTVTVTNSGSGGWNPRKVNRDCTDPFWHRLSSPALDRPGAHIVSIFEADGHVNLQVLTLSSILILNGRQRLRFTEWGEGGSRKPGMSLCS